MIVSRDAVGRIEAIPNPIRTEFFGFPKDRNAEFARNRGNRIVTLNKINGIHGKN